MAMLHEVYGAEGAIAYSQIYTVEELKLLLDQSYELRRDPKEKETERQQKEAREWVEKNRNRVLQVPTGDGFRQIPVAFFSDN